MMARLLLLTPCVAAQILMTETFDSPAGFTTTNANGNVPFFSDGNSDYFGINNGNGASTFSGTGPSAGTDNVPSGAPAYTGFNGAYLTGEDLDGEGYNPPFTITWPAVSGACAGTLVFAGKFAEDGSRSIDADDYIIVQVSVDGAPPATVLEFRGNDLDRSNGAFAEDTNGDGVGDGTILTLAAQTFQRNIPGTMTSSVQLMVFVRTGSSN